MTRAEARHKQADLKEELDILVEQHIEMLDAAARLYRDITQVTKELDMVGARLEHDGTSFQPEQPSEPTFTDLMNIFDNLTVRK